MNNIITEKFEPYYISNNNTENKCYFCFQPLLPKQRLVAHTGIGHQHPAHFDCTQRIVEYMKRQTCLVCFAKVDPHSLYTWKDKAFKFLKDTAYDALISTATMGVLLAFMRYNNEFPQLPTDGSQPELKLVMDHLKGKFWKFISLMGTGFFTAKLVNKDAFAASLWGAMFAYGYAVFQQVDYPGHTIGDYYHWIKECPVGAEFALDLYQKPEMAAMMIEAVGEMVGMNKPQMQIAVACLVGGIGLGILYKTPSNLRSLFRP